MAIKIYVTDLAKYNEGELVGEWFDVSDFTTIDEMLEACNVGWNIPGVERNEWFISDFDSPCDIGLKGFDFPCVSAEEIETWKELDELIDENHDLICAMSEAGYSVDEIIEHHEDVYLIDANSEFDLGYEVVSECYDLEKMMGNLSSYFDYEAFGRDLVLNGDYTYTDFGYLSRL